jgi:hypothetical protein
MQRKPWTITRNDLPVFIERIMAEILLRVKIREMPMIRRDSICRESVASLFFAGSVVLRADRCVARATDIV